MSKQILLIDGDKDHSISLKTYIERLQHDVTIASTFEELKQHLDSKKTDVILADPYIHNNTASCLLAKKKETPLVQIIIFTSKDRLDSAMDFFKSNALGYLELPINRKALELFLAQAQKNIALNQKIKQDAKTITKLQGAHNFYRQLFEEVPCYISVQDRTLRITASNKRFKRHFDSRTGGFCYEIYKHRTSQCPDCPVVETFRDGKSHSTEEIVTTTLGKQYNVLTRTAPLKNEKGEIIQVMEMSTNITQIRQLQDHLISLGLMLTSMSHGVKGMLTALDGGIYQFETGLTQKDDNRLFKAFGQITQITEKIKKMVLEMLYYAKSRQLQYEEMAITDLAQTVVDTVKPMAQNYGIKLDVSIPKTLGKIDVDSNWMAASLVNFLENAVDACVIDKDKSKHCITFDVKKTSRKTVCFTITDNGMGMDTETKNKMFTLFFSSKGSQGTGLGLFIAHRVIQYHGGTVDVDSTPGKGSSFCIRLPLQKPDDVKNNTICRDEPLTLPLTGADTQG
ncbi:MAG: GHKL domain-containing protein [Proteobacteria bacterium]|nr:GHKL domain-containing protein [Pseudomonadota bacterium]MBU1585320.1 GHKL domain-containing protein [Pseudomonadota bacterium]MBU2456194.1 GHKL domain-containing protein [Pseudomonadota bacterium]MBU2627991.1 GHKL domain-containing protein [Pseudomonadota bacterium]